MKPRRPAMGPSGSSATVPSGLTQAECVERFWDVLAPALLQHYARETATPIADDVRRAR